MVVGMVAGMAGATPDLSARLGPRAGLDKTVGGAGRREVFNPSRRAAATL
jgi:hypothetical protein